MIARPPRSSVKKLGPVLVGVVVVVVDVDASVATGILL